MRMALKTKKQQQQRKPPGGKKKKQKNNKKKTPGFRSDSCQICSHGTGEESVTWPCGTAHREAWECLVVPPKKERKWIHREPLPSATTLWTNNHKSLKL